MYRNAFDLNDSCSMNRATDTTDRVPAWILSCAISYFPVRIRLALSHRIDPYISNRVLKYVASLVFSWITRSDGSSKRPAWSRHMPAVYHPCMALIRSSNGLGDSVIRLNELIRLKIAKHAHDLNATVHASADLLLHLFLASQEYDEQTEDDSGNANSFLIELLWISEGMRNAQVRLSCRILETLDDQFTSRVSPYRGIKLSKPVWSTLNNVISDCYTRILGVPTTCPSDESSSGLIMTAGVDDFVNELSTTIISVRVYETLIEKVMQILSNFNSRHLKALSNRDSSSPISLSSFQAMLTSPWCDDVEVRAITAAYLSICKIVRGRCDTSVLFGAVLSGAWRAIEQLDVIKSVSSAASQGETSIIFEGLGEAELRLNSWRLLARSYTNPPSQFVLHLQSAPQYKRESTALRIQSWWRGVRLRKIHLKNMRIICIFIQNVGWPDIVPDLFQSGFDTTPITVNKNSSLTRASLMRLVPASKPVQGESRQPQQGDPHRAITPTASSVSGTHAHRDAHEDELQADHIACGKLFFILVYSMYLQRLMYRFFIWIIRAIDEVSKMFVDLILQNAQYEVALSETAESLKRSALLHKRSSQARNAPRIASVSPRPNQHSQFKVQRPQIKKKLGPLPVKKDPPRPPPPVDSTRKHNRAEEALGQSSDMSKGTQEYIQGSNPVADNKIISFDDKYLSDYVRFFEGDDTLTRDIAADGVNFQLFPQGSSSALSMIWLPIQATRFASSRARIISLLKTDAGRSLFQRSEGCYDFINCINILTDTPHGSLNIFGTPSSTQPFWIEHVYHMAVGFIAHYSNAKDFEGGLSFVSNILRALPSSLRKLNQAHQLCIEAMMYDAALGFAYQFAAQASNLVEAWHDEAAKRYIRLGHRVRYVKCCIRLACVLSKQERYELCIRKISTAINAIADFQNTSIMMLARLDRAIATYWVGRPEGAELEVRDVTVKCKKLPALYSICELADNIKQILIENREGSRITRH